MLFKGSLLSLERLKLALYAPAAPEPSVLG